MTVERFDIKNRGQWLALRKQDMTASEIGVLFGVHPYLTQLEVFMRKAGEGGADQGENAAMRRGRILEPGVAVAVGDEYPDWRLEKANCYVRDVDARIGATPDYFVHGDPRGLGILECKSAAPEIFQSQWANGAPRAHLLQCLTQMMVTEAAFGLIACLVDNRAKDLFCFDVPRHAKAEAMIREKTAAFWAAVKAGDLPAPDYTRDAESIAAMFPRGGGPPIDLTADNRLPELLANRERLMAAVKESTGELEAVNAEIKFKLGDAAEAFLPGWRLTFRLQQRKGYTVADSESRVLRVTKLTQEAA